MSSNKQQCLIQPTMSGSVITTEKLVTKYRQSVTIWKAFLSKYLRYISSPSRQEAILKTVQYSLWFLSRVYTKLPTSNANDPNKQQNMIESFAALSGELSWARYLLRFFGFPAALEAVDSGSWSSSSKGIGKAMAWTMIGYYPLEHLAYLYWKAPKVQWITGSTTTSSVATMWNPFGKNKTVERNSSPSAICPATDSSLTSSEMAAKASAWSCRFWLAYLVLDIVRSAMELQNIRQIRSNQQNNNEYTKKTIKHNGNNLETEEDTTSPASDEYTSVVRSERLQIARSLLYILPAIHWSLPNWDTKPWLSNDAVNGLCLLEAVVGMYQGIRNFQES